MPVELGTEPEVVIGERRSRTTGEISANSSEKSSVTPAPRARSYHFPRGSHPGARVYPRRRDCRLAASAVANVLARPEDRVPQLPANGAERGLRGRAAGAVLGRAGGPRSRAGPHLASRRRPAAASALKTARVERGLERRSDVVLPLAHGRPGSDLRRSSAGWRGRPPLRDAYAACVHDRIDAARTSRHCWTRAAGNCETRPAHSQSCSARSAASPRTATRASVGCRPRSGEGSGPEAFGMRYDANLSLRVHRLGVWMTDRSAAEGGWPPTIVRSACWPMASRRSCASRTPTTGSAGRPCGATGCLGHAAGSPSRHQRSHPPRPAR